MFYTEITKINDVSIKNISTNDLLKAQSELEQLMENGNYDIYGIHDEVRQLPNHAHKSKQYYNEVLANINDSNLFTDILSEILNTTIPPMEGDLNSEDILKAVYSLS